MSLDSTARPSLATAGRVIVRAWLFLVRGAVVPALLELVRRLLGRIQTEKCLRNAAALARNELEDFANPAEAQSPIAFVVPVFNARPKYLNDLLSSMKRQTAGAWRLVLSDDGSTDRRTRAWLTKHESDSGVAVVWNAVNRGIAAATNAGIARAEAPWIGLLDHDDALAPFAVDRIARALAKNPDCQFLYTDEVIADGRLWPTALFLKPAWDPVLLSGVNYINHLSLYRRERLIEIGGLRDGFQGSQDYDLLLRYTNGLRADEIRHLPYPAYIWRRDGKSHSVRFVETATDNARRALTESLSSTHPEVVVDRAGDSDLHRVRFDLLQQEWPLVSVVIPNRNSARLIRRVVEGLTQTDYPNLEIIVVDNGSDDFEVLSLYQEWEKKSPSFRVRIDV